MFDSIIQLIKDLWKEYIQFWFFVYQYQEAIVYRKGRIHRKRGPGLHLRWPFIEEAAHALVIPTTHDLKHQALVTKDGKQYTVRGMIKARVEDSQKFLTEVYDQVDALADTTMGIIARIVMDSDEKDLRDINYDINNKITIKTRAAAKVYGIHVMQVTLIEITPTRSMRLFTDKVTQEESKE